MGHRQPSAPLSGSRSQCDAAAQALRSPSPLLVSAPCPLYGAPGGVFVGVDIAQTFQDSCALTAPLPCRILLATSVRSSLEAPLGPLSSSPWGSVETLAMGSVSLGICVLGQLHN